MAKYDASKPLKENVEAVHGKGHKPVRPIRTGKGHLWKPPKDMPDDLIELVRAGKACGARLKSCGYCRKAPVKGQREAGRAIPFRCAQHGGASPGVATGSRHNLKHGFYAEAILPGEEDLDPDLESFKHEIHITKLRLRRALVAERKQEEDLQKQWADGEELSPTMLPSEMTEVEGVGPEGPISTTTKKMKTIDWAAHINTVINQLVRLTNQQNIIEGGQGDTTPEQRANLARQFLREARESTFGKDGG